MSKRKSWRTQERDYQYVAREMKADALRARLFVGVLDTHCICVGCEQALATVEAKAKGPT